METTYCEIIMNLENDMSRMKEVLENLPGQMKYAIELYKVALDQMRKPTIQKDLLSSNQKSVFEGFSNH